MAAAIEELIAARESHDSRRLVAALKHLQEQPAQIKSLGGGVLPGAFADLCDIYAEQGQFAQALKAAKKASELFKQELNTGKSQRVLVEFGRATYRNARSLGGADKTSDEFKEPALRLARLAVFLERKSSQNTEELKAALVTLIERLEAKGEFVEASEYFTELELVDPPVIQ